MTPETAPASPQAQREALGHGSGPTDPPQASHGAAKLKIGAIAKTPAGCIVRVDRIAPGTWPYCEDVAEVTFIDGSPYNYHNSSHGNYLAKELEVIA